MEEVRLFIRAEGVRPDILGSEEEGNDHRLKCGRLGSERRLVRRSRKYGKGGQYSLFDPNILQFSQHPAGEGSNNFDLPHPLHRYYSNPLGFSSPHPAPSHPSQFPVNFPTPCKLKTPLTAKLHNLLEYSMWPGSNSSVNTSRTASQNGDVEGSFETGFSG
jgi:hypothetical protein